MISAYRNIDKTPVVVVINYSDKDRNFELKWKVEKLSAWKPYLTSDLPDSNLTPQSVVNYGKKIIIPARSIITYIGVK
jgi:hypothetical protein